MSDPEAGKPRGEAAWLAHRAAIDARNQVARQAGKARHDEWQRLREAGRRATEAREEQRFVAARRES